MIRGIRIAVFALTLIAFSASAHAACTSPAKPAGSKEWFAAGSTYKFCDGTTWIDFLTDGTLGACTAASDLEWDNTETAFKFCDGSNWQKVFCIQVCEPGSISSGSMSEVGAISTVNLDEARSVAVSGKYAYIAADSPADALTVIDISTPSSPVEVGSITGANLNTAEDVAVSGNYAYVVAVLADALTVIDISTPSSPVEVGSVTGVNLNSANGVAVSGNYAYVTARSADALTVIDISTPSSPVEVGSVTSLNMDNARDVDISGGYAYVVSSRHYLTVIDISNPASPVEVGAERIADLTTGELNVAVSGNFAYVTSFTEDSLTVIDISNPASPVEVGTISTGNLDGALGVYVSGIYAYVGALFADALTVIDISNPASPVEVGTISTGNLGGAGDLAVFGNYAYVISENNPGLTVIDTGCTAPSCDLGACSTAAEIDYRPTDKALTYCDGVQWHPMARGDTTPDAFDFSDVFSATQSQVYEDSTVVTGFDAPLTASVTGADAQVRKNGAGVWGANVSVDPGDILNIRMTASASADTAVQADLTLGTASVDWTVDTTQIAVLENSASAFNVGSVTNYTLNFGFTATAGRLLVFAASWDKVITGLTEGSGTWTQIAFETSTTSVSGAMYYKISDGTETSIPLSWTNTEDISIWVGEYSNVVGASPLDQSVSANSGGTAVTSQSTGTTPVTTQANDFAIAMFGSDSSANTVGGRAWTNGFTELIHVCNGCGSDPGLGVATKNLTATGAVETTFSTTNGGDQMVGMVAVFKKQ